MKRREFIRITAAGVPLGIPFLLNQGCSTTALLRDPAAAGSLVVRPEVRSAAALPHLKSYALAVSRMRALAATDGRSWAAQAGVHNDNCFHNSWFFFPWHRDYLLRFEQIIRQQSGDANFLLPYWDWTVNPALPPQFMNAADATFGPLACSSRAGTPDPSRAPAKASAITLRIGNLTNANVLSRIMAVGDFPTFMGADGAAGATEAGPHNGVHATLGALGGPMGNFTSPLDPIFWLHHCNVDRIWSVWQDKHPEWKDPAKISAVVDEGKSGAEWLRGPLQGFFDLAGKKVAPASARKATDMLDVAKLGYTYTVAAGTMASTRQFPGQVFTPMRTVSGSEASILLHDGRNNFGSGNTDAFLFLKTPSGVLGEKLDKYMNASSEPSVRFRLKVTGLPRILLPGSDGVGPSMRIGLIPAGTAREVFIGDFNSFVPQHPGMNMAQPAVYYDYSLVLDELKAEGLRRVPDPVRLRIHFVNPATGEAFAVDPAAFRNVDIRLIAIE